jgi:hypothetical protein
VTSPSEEGKEVKASMLIELTAGMVVTAVLFEIWLVWKFPLLLALFQRNSVISIPFSMLLSWVLGELFGASGTVVLLSAVASTLVTAVFYRFGTGALTALQPVFAML